MDMATGGSRKIDNPDEWPESARSTPGFSLAWTYKRAWLRRDLAAGLVIFAVTVPSALAYGEMAGLDAVNGLYACLVAMALYALFGTSRQLVIGAEAAVAILVASSLASIASGGDPARYLALAMLQALLAGGILIIAGVARVGFIADFVPRAVVVGFLNGMALIIILSQVGKMLGFNLQHEEFFPRLWEIITKIHDTHSAQPGDRRRLSSRFIPVSPVACQGARGHPGGGPRHLAVIIWDLKDYGVKVVGAIPAGLPHVGIPHVSFIDILKLLPISVGIAFVSYMDTTITGRNFANQERLSVKPPSRDDRLGTGQPGKRINPGIHGGLQPFPYCSE